MAEEKARFRECLIGDHESFLHLSFSSQFPNALTVDCGGDPTGAFRNALKTPHLTGLLALACSYRMQLAGMEEDKALNTIEMRDIDSPSFSLFGMSGSNIKSERMLELGIEVATAIQKEINEKNHSIADAVGETVIKLQQELILKLQKKSPHLTQDDAQAMIRECIRIPSTGQAEAHDNDAIYVSFDHTPSPCVSVSGNGPEAPELPGRKETADNFYAMLSRKMPRDAAEFFSYTNTESDAARTLREREMTHEEWAKSAPLPDEKISFPIPPLLQDKGLFSDFRMRLLTACAELLEEDLRAARESLRTVREAEKPAKLREHLKETYTLLRKNVQSMLETEGMEEKDAFRLSHRLAAENMLEWRKPFSALAGNAQHSR